MMFRVAVCLFSMMIATSCAYNVAPRCKGTIVDDDVLINTSKMFLKSEGEPDYGEFQYRVMNGMLEGCRVVAVLTTPDAFDSEILISIGRDGVVRAVAPDGEPFFDIRGDRAWGLRPTKAYPLVK